MVSDLMLCPLSLVISESSISHGGIAKLLQLVLVLVVGNGHSVVDDLLDQPFALVHFSLAVGRDPNVKRLIAVVCSPISCKGPGSPFFDRALAPYSDGCTSLFLHGFESCIPGS